MSTYLEVPQGFQERPTPDVRRRVERGGAGFIIADLHCLHGLVEATFFRMAPGLQKFVVKESIKLRA